MYDPSIGKWLSADPIGFDGKDTNLYRYVANSPTTATDPTGLTKGSDIIKILLKRNARGILLNWWFGDDYEIADDEGTIIGECGGKSEEFIRGYVEACITLKGIPEDGAWHTLKLEQMDDIRIFTGGSDEDHNWTIRSQNMLGNGGFWINGATGIEVKGGTIQARIVGNGYEIGAFEVHYVWHDCIDANDFIQQRERILLALQNMPDDTKAALGALGVFFTEGSYDVYEKLNGSSFNITIPFTHKGNLSK